MKQTINTPEQLGLLLQSARKRSQLTQSDIAGLLDLSQATMSRLELNTHNMKVSQLLRLCQRLGLELIVRDRASATPSAESAAGRKAEW